MKAERHRIVVEDVVTSAFANPTQKLLLKAALGDGEDALESWRTWHAGGNLIVGRNKRRRDELLAHVFQQVHVHRRVEVGRLGRLIGSALGRPPVDWVRRGGHGAAERRRSARSGGRGKKLSS